MVGRILGRTMSSGDLGRSDREGIGQWHDDGEYKAVIPKRWEGIHWIRLADEIKTINNELWKSLKDDEQNADLLTRQAELLEQMWSDIDPEHLEHVESRSLERVEGGLSCFEPKAIDLMNHWGINPNELTKQKVEERWRVLVQKVHPDRNPGIHGIEFIRLRMSKNYLLQLCVKA